MDTECAVEFVQYLNLSSTDQGDLGIFCLIRNIINVSGIWANFSGSLSFLIETGEFFFFQFCINERIGYRTLPDSFGKHESFSDSHIIKLLFWGIQFKLGLSSALVGEIELLCLSILFDSDYSLRKPSRNKTPDLTTTGGSELMICLWSDQGYAEVPFVLI